MSLGATLALAVVSDEWLPGVLVGCAVSFWALSCYFASELGLTVNLETPDPKSKQVCIISTYRAVSDSEADPASIEPRTTPDRNCDSSASWPGDLVLSLRWQAGCHIGCNGS
jgi:hypothetical protein